MSKTVKEWVNTDVEKIKGTSYQILAEQYFFRDPSRPYNVDSSYLFSPADGIIMYQKIVEPDECVVQIKGENHTLQNAMQDFAYSKKSLVIGIFMTFYDVHINRMPSFGYLSYKYLERIQSYNYPMLDIENDIVEKFMVNFNNAEYMFYNERLLNTIFAPAIKQNYYIIQIADYGVKTILPFSLKQHQPFFQTRRFSQIRYGSQVDLIIPISDSYEFELLQTTEMHVEAGIDPLIKILPKDINL